YQKAVQQGSEEAGKALGQLLIDNPSLAKNIFNFYGGAIAQGTSNSQQTTTSFHASSPSK
ncbi:MAG: hypothetical protein JSR33_06945, partial [Proteobacteria bacterium]|nr:hypothetical protein [Pseudomonadota bacterium]